MGGQKLEISFLKEPRPEQVIADVLRSRGIRCRDVVESYHEGIEIILSFYRQPQHQRNRRLRSFKKLAEKLSSRVDEPYRRTFVDELFEDVFFTMAFFEKQNVQYVQKLRRERKVLTKVDAKYQTIELILKLKQLNSPSLKRRGKKNSLSEAVDLFHRIFDCLGVHESKLDYSESNFKKALQRRAKRQRETDCTSLDGFTLSVYSKRKDSDGRAILLLPEKRRPNLDLQP